ncbi:hypothetical protein [Algicola sagamiensis]|uniref:hypothetical protein n=1 Tax=Algicola sagamiensis TaxID=163869 RepID=UPI0003772DE6|nr:hypothetical protein [Algicola sagamiensis]
MINKTLTISFLSFFLILLSGCEQGEHVAHSQSTSSTKFTIEVAVQPNGEFQQTKNSNGATVDVSGIVEPSEGGYLVKIRYERLDQSGHPKRQLATRVFVESMAPIVVGGYSDEAKKDIVQLLLLKNDKQELSIKVMEETSLIPS